MTIGKPRGPKVAMSFSTRRIRLGIAGSPSSWTAPVKEPPGGTRPKPKKLR